MLSIFPVGSTTVKVISFEPDGTWDFGVAFRYGRGRSFNTYTRYYLRRWGDNRPDDLWDGWPTNAPDPMDASERRRVYDWIELDTRARRWLERKIRALSVAAV